jgi:hypothetical protein
MVLIAVDVKGDTSGPIIEEFGTEAIRLSITK